MISKIPPHVRWVGLVVGLLGMSVLIQVTAVVLSGREPLGLVENYESKAASWNEHADQLAQNEALGWRVELSTEELPAGAQVEIELLDAFGEPLDSAQVAGTAFHNARADARLPFELLDLGGGRYGAALPFVRTGIYEFQLEILRGGERFTAVLQDTVRVGS